MVEFIPNSLEYIRMLAGENLLSASLIFVGLYILVGVFSLPGAGLLTTTSGAIFGFALGGSLSAIGAWIGAVIIFVAVKYFSADYFKSKCKGPKLSAITEKIHAHELKGLLFVRLTPIFPFFITNILAGVLGVKLSNYMIATAAGMIWSFVYAGVGAGLFELVV